MDCKNEILLKTISLLICVNFCLSLTCLECSDKNFNGEQGNSGTCFQPTFDTEVCTSLETTAYCESNFLIQDGVVVAISRGCTTGAKDKDLNTDSRPTGSICKVEVNESGNPTATTGCIIPCSTNRCNSATSGGLLPCSSDCGISKNQGNCDYITGECVCNRGFGGADCSRITSSAPSISCYQCTSETDKNCSMNPSTDFQRGCPNDEQYCATTRTIIFDQSFGKVAEVVTRGCTDRFVAVDECAYTDIYDDSPINGSSLGYSEYICYSTCDSPNCNENTADGDIDSSEGKNLQCVQCTGTGNGICEPGSDLVRSMCGGSERYCKTTVHYLLSERKDINYFDENPPHKIMNVTRECIDQPVTTVCSEEKTPGGVGTLYSCSETCQTDGCNTGWPVRPKCIQCSSYTDENNHASGYDQCLENPPVASDCPFPFQQYCYIHDEGMTESHKGSLQGYPRRIIRGCSFVNYGTGCSTQTVLGQNVQICNRTCSSNGCNYGNGSEQNQHSVTFIMFSFLLALTGEMLSRV